MMVLVPDRSASIHKVRPSVKGSLFGAVSLDINGCLPDLLWLHSWSRKQLVLVNRPCGRGLGVTDFST
jgi:hypothetical protein